MGIVDERRKQRVRALGAILRSASSITIFSIAGFVILGDLGINLAPLLASAGVVGVAIGFGAQSLVRDYLSGIFMLVEDQYGVGDVITVGDATGTVENVTLRITRMRDVNGIVWHIRNGTIEHGRQRVAGLGAGGDRLPGSVRGRPDRRSGTCSRGPATSMWNEPIWRAVMLEAPEVWGAQEISSSRGHHADGGEDRAAAPVGGRAGDARPGEAGAEGRGDHAAPGREADLAVTLTRDE